VETRCRQTPAAAAASDLCALLAPGWERLDLRRWLVARPDPGVGAKLRSTILCASSRPQLPAAGAAATAETATSMLSATWQAG